MINFNADSPLLLSILSANLDVFLHIGEKNIRNGREGLPFSKSYFTRLLNFNSDTPLFLSSLKRFSNFVKLGCICLLMGCATVDFHINWYLFESAVNRVWGRTMMIRQGFLHSFLWDVTLSRAAPLPVFELQGVPNGAPHVSKGVGGFSVTRY